MSIEAANKQVLEIFQTARPVVIDIQQARDVVPNMTPDLILHAGAPIRVQDMCGSMKGGVAGALMYEGLAPDLETAYAMIEAGDVNVDSCHHHDAVAPMAGIISASMPVWIMENKTDGARAYSNLNEGPGRALRYGANSPDVIDRLRWIEHTLAPRLLRAIKGLVAEEGGLAIFPMVAEAVEMGDECHSRNHAALTLLIQKLTPPLLNSGLTAGEVREVLTFMIGRDYFFLNLTMAACKAAWLKAEAVPESSIVSAFSRNGVKFAIRVQGQWFTADSPIVEGHYFEGYSAVDANVDIGDSAITEASGLGGFVAGGAPAMTGFIGGTAAELMREALTMYDITVEESHHFRQPALENRGAPTGVDVRKVLETQTRPFITTGIAHRLPGMGQIGAGRVRAPLECFEKAAETLGLAQPTSANPG